MYESAILMSPVCNSFRALSWVVSQWETVFLLHAGDEDVSCSFGMESVYAPFLIAVLRFISVAVSLGLDFIFTLLCLHDATSALT